MTERGCDTRVDRRTLMRGSAATALGSLPVLVSSARTARGESLSGPTGIHIAYGPSPMSSMSVGWSGPPADDAYVRYGRPGDLDTTVQATTDPIPGADRVAFQAALFGLSPETEYAYEVVVDGVRSPRYSFTTVPEAGDSFRVTAVGDHGIDDPNNEFQRADTDDPLAVIDLANETNPAFHLGVGDISYANGYPATWDHYFETFEEFYATTPFMTVPGNHEKEPGTGFVSYDGRLNALMPIADPTLPGLESKQRWYDFEFGNALFVGLNTSADACGDYARGEEFVPLYDTRCRTQESRLYNERQGNYVEETLRAADNDPEIDWKIVYLHSSLWTDGEHDAREDLREQWGAHFDEYDVDLVLAGHNHVYERSKPLRLDGVSETGTTYLVNGTGGTSHYSFQHQTAPKWTAFRDGEHFGVTQLDISSSRLDVQYLAADGTVVDEFIIVKRNGEPAQI